MRKRYKTEKFLSVIINNFTFDKQNVLNVEEEKNTVWNCLSGNRVHTCAYI